MVPSVGIYSTNYRDGYVEVMLFHHTYLPDLCTIIHAVGPTSFAFLVVSRAGIPPFTRARDVLSAVTDQSEV